MLIAILGMQKTYDPYQKAKKQKNHRKHKSTLSPIMTKVEPYAHLSNGHSNL
jgi:hypothetical protein